MKSEKQNSFFKNIIENIKNGNLLILTIILLAFSMSFYRIILPYFIWLIGGSWLLSRRCRQGFKTLWSNIYFLLILSFFAYHLVGLIYTNNMKEGIFIVMNKLSLIVFPLTFFSSSEIILKRKDTILSSFIGGLFTAAILCYINAFYQAHVHASDGNFFNFDVWNLYPEKSFFELILTGNSYLNYGWLSVFIHVSYFSMYLVLAMYIIYQRLISGNYNKTIYFSLFVTFLITIILLQSRASLIALFGIIILESIRYFVSPGKRIIKFSIVSSIFITIILLIVFSGRFNRILPNNDTNHISYEQLKANNVRLQVWEKSYNIIKGNILFGVGTGDAHDTLKKQYTAELLDASHQMYLNVHNEFLETTMRLGIPGLLLLIGLIVVPLFTSKEQKFNYNLLVIFVLLTIIEYFFESMMVRLNGVIFFAFFYSLLNLHKTET